MFDAWFLTAACCVSWWTMQPATGLAATPHERAAQDSETVNFANLALEPFWRASVMRESMFFIQKDAETAAESTLLFKPSKILSVTIAARETAYEADRDYVFDDKHDRLRLSERSRIPFKTLDELYPLMTSSAPKIARQNGDKARGIFFDNAAGYHGLQIEVTYECAPGQWSGFVPEFAGDRLPEVMKKLCAKQPVKLILCGDSISAGYNASKFTQARPGCPAYGELVALALEKQYGSPIAFTNHAVGGWTAGQGLQHAREKKLGRQSPDLVMIAFGMNDVFARDAKAYQQKVKGIIDEIRKDSPTTEFILVASMLGNAEWGMPMEQFALHRDALQQLCGAGVVLADLTKMWEDLLKRKSFYDLTGNGVNHPNDFGHAIYAQVIVALLLDREVDASTSAPRNADEASSK